MSEVLDFVSSILGLGFLIAISIFMVWMIVMLFIGQRYDEDDGRGT
jgi:hypothetical protein